MEETSFGEWYRDAQPGLLESVLRVVNRRPVAEDAVEEAFEKAFARWERVQAMRSPNGWVYRVAVNAARQQLAREGREAERLAVAHGRDRLEPPPGGEAWLLVSQLPIRQRTAVVLRHVAGMTEAEIGRAMGVTRSTISSSLSSAYTTLARHLAEPTAPNEVDVMELSLALAISCDPDGAEVDDLGTGTRRRLGWSDAVRDSIRVRPGDLVAVDADEVVWRWWGATVVATAGDDGLVVERNIAQHAEGDPRTGRFDVALPDDLDAGVGDRVWFGRDGDRFEVVAVGEPDAVIRRMAPRLPSVAEALGG